MSTIAIVLVLTLPVLCVLTIIGMAVRVLVRHYARGVRGRRIGDLVWSEILYNSTASPQNELTPAMATGVNNLGSAIRSTRWPYADRGVCSVVWHRQTDGSLHLYVGMSKAHFGDGSTIRAFASSINASAQTLEEAPTFPHGSMRILHRLQPTVSSVADRVDSCGGVAEALNSSLEQLPEGEEASVIVTMDMLRNSEQSRLQAYIAEDTVRRVGNSANFGVAKPAGQMVTNALRMSMAATTGSASAGGIASSLLTTAASAISTMGWQFSVKEPSFVPARALAAVSGVALVLSSILLYTTTVPLWLGVALIVVLLGALAFSATIGGSLNTKLFLDWASRGEVVVPSFFWWNPRWELYRNITARRSDAASDHQVGNRISFPSGRQVGYLHPLALLEYTTFPVGAKLNNIHQEFYKSRGLPKAMLDSEWPIFMGKSGTGQLISTDATQMHFSEYVAGVPSSGKTNYLLVHFAGLVKLTMDKDFPYAVTPIWTETKGGSGADDAWSVAQYHPKAVQIDLSNPHCRWRIAFEGPRLSDGATPAQVLIGARRLVASMQFAYGDEIKSSSRQFLDNAFRVAMLLLPEELESMGLESRVDVERPNLIELAFLILNRDPNLNTGDKLLALRDELADDFDALDDREVALYNAISELQKAFDPQQRRSVEQFLSAPTNKLSDLRDHQAFEPGGKRDVYLHQLIGRQAPIVLNMGSYKSNDGLGYEENTPLILNRSVMLMFNYLLWETVKQRCSGWLEAGKRLVIYSDEVSDIAVDSESTSVPNVLADALKQGRGLGFSYRMASQFPSQMPFQARHNALSCQTKFWFRVTETNDVKMAVEDLAAGDTTNQPYQGSDIKNLPTGVAVGVMVRGKHISPPFTLRTPKFDTWASCLLNPENSISDAVAEYYEYEDIDSRARRIKVTPPSWEDTDDETYQRAIER